ncbi:MAG: hypothetical protein NVS4B4_11170 [Bradyrhizobium sp.]
MTLAGCYMATVNESETITEAQPIGLVRSRSGTNQDHGFGYRFAVAPHIERS